GEGGAKRRIGLSCLALYNDLPLRPDRRKRAPHALGRDVMAKPLVVIDASPCGLNEIFDAGLWARLQAAGEVVAYEGDGRMPADRLEALLPDIEVLIGQSDMPLARLDRAPKLRAIVNVETNFLQNVDYDACFARGVHVLTP